MRLHIQILPVHLHIRDPLRLQRAWALSTPASTGQFYSQTGLLGPENNLNVFITR